MVELKLFTEADFQSLIAWIDSPEFLMQWGGPGFQLPLDESQPRPLVRARSSKNPQLMAFTAVDPDSHGAVVSPSRPTPALRRTGALPARRTAGDGRASRG